MTNKDLDLAREWAEFHAHTELVMDGAASRVIQSLPDQWINADRVWEVLDMWAGNPFPTSDEVAVLNDFEALLTPPLPTLAELIEAGNKPEDYQWAWVDTEDGLQVITMVGDFDDKYAYVMDKDGYRSARGWSEVRPRPDLQKWEWPGSVPKTFPGEECQFMHPPECYCGDAPDQQGDSSESPKSSMPRPEDVPAGEPWIVLCGGKRWVGIRASGLDEHSPWSIVRMDGLDYQNVADSKIALISRLVPEVAP